MVIELFFRRNVSILSLGVEAIDSFAECDCPGATLSCVRDDATDSTNGKCPPCPTSCPTPGLFPFVSNHNTFLFYFIF